MSDRITTNRSMTYIGIDLGDRRSQVCVMNQDGDVMARHELGTNPQAFRRYFASVTTARIAIEVGTHSPWVSRLLESLGHQVFIANARRVRLIYENPNKNDRLDAEWLARLVRLDPKLLGPIQHRSLPAQKDLALLRSRDALVRARTRLISHVRGSVKTMGSRLRGCGAESFHRVASQQIPDELLPALEPVLELIESLTQRIRKFDRVIERVARARYPVTDLLMQVSGVGILTATCFVLTLEDPSRFRRNRSVGPYLGLVPKRSQSGQADPQRRITKAGDSAVRRLLVQSAHYILGPFGPDSDLRRWGLKLAARGGKNAKKRAAVAVARRLAVLLLSLWKTAEVYEPLRQQQPHQELLSA